MGGGLTALVEALHRGGRVIWDDPPAHPRLTAPPELRGPLLADRETLRLVLGRAAAFRAHLGSRDFLPVMVLPDRPPGDRGCISCGVETTTIRCAVCSIALWIALDNTPPLSILKQS